ncbi:MAG: hypothetical protein LBD24_05675 [Spirochaetaceae bacterium]|nr:hypothetical protein [Spirochaetaceae bacterium]
MIDDLVINGDESGYMFRGPAESAARLHKDTVVIHICLATNNHTHPDGTIYPLQVASNTPVRLPSSPLPPPCMYPAPVPH